MRSRICARSSEDVYRSVQPASLRVRMRGLAAEGASTCHVYRLQMRSDLRGHEASLGCGLPYRAI